MKANKVWLFWSMLLLFLCGCVPNQSVEERAILQIAGYDLIEEDTIKGTVAIPQYGRSEKKTSATELYLSVTAESVKEVEKEIQKRSSKPISVGKLSVTLFNESLVKRGLADYLDVLSRDPRLSRNMFLGVVTGETQPLIENGYVQEETTAKHINGLIENNIQYNYPTTSLQDFLYSYYAQGIDGFLPYLTQKETFVELDGLALFKGEKLVSKIPDSKVFVFKMLKENFNKGMQEIDFKEGKVMLESIGSNVDYEIKGKADDLSFHIDINMNAVVNEVEGVELSVNDALIKEIEKTATEYYQKNAEELIEQFQSENIDPLGLGNFLKSRRGHFDDKQWDDKFPTVPIKVNIKIDITEYGIFS